MLSFFPEVESSGNEREIPVLPDTFLHGIWISTVNGKN